MASEHHDLPESSRRDAERQENMLRELELKRKIKATVVPTDDVRIRSMLRQLGEPVTLFGEREMERRERLRRLIALNDSSSAVLEGSAVTGKLVLEEALVLQRELFYTEGPPALRTARLAVADFSLRKAVARLAGAKRQRDEPEERQAWQGRLASTFTALQDLTIQVSNVGDERPIAACAFAPDGATLATSGWSGLLAGWSVPGCEKRWAVRAHTERVTGIAWHPEAHLSQPSTSVNLATASADCTAKLWSATGEPLATLSGHTDRLARVAFHPSGRLVATACFDATWRLWDVDSGAFLMEQEGHSRAVYAVAFHPDGSLCGSGGLDSIGRIWDCRTGRCLWAMEGHVKPILALDFSPNGHHVVTGSEDNSCKVWDLRNRKCVYTLPGHRSLVSCVRYEPHHGSYIVSCAYDNLIKVWSGKTFALQKTLAGHEGKVMGVDIRPGGEPFLASVAYDRTIKFWAPELMPQLDMML